MDRVGQPGARTDCRGDLVVARDVWLVTNGMKTGTRKGCGLRGRSIFWAALLLGGCVGMDVGGGPQGEDARESYASLNSEQLWQLREASRDGDHELVATVSRMAWDNPNYAVEFGHYAAALRPEAAAQIASAVTRAVTR